MRRPVAHQRGSRIANAGIVEVFSGDDNHIVARFEVVEQVITAVGRDLRSQRSSQIGGGIQLNGDAIHAGFAIVNDAVVVGIKPDAVAQAVNRGKAKVESRVMGRAQSHQRARAIVHDILALQAGIASRQGEGAGEGFAAEQAEAVVVVVVVLVGVGVVAGRASVIIAGADGSGRGNDRDDVIARWQIVEAIEAAGVGGGGRQDSSAVRRVEGDRRAAENGFASGESAVLVGVGPDQIAHADFVEAEIHRHVGAVIGVNALTNAAFQPGFTRRLGRIAEGDRLRNHRAIESAARGVARAIVVMVSVIFRADGGGFQYVIRRSRVAIGLRRPVAGQRACAAEVGGGQDNDIVAGVEVIKQIEAATGRGIRRQRRAGRVAGGIGGVELHGHAVHADFSAVDGVAVIGVEPDAVAEGVGVDKAEVEAGIAGQASGVARIGSAKICARHRQQAGGNAGGRRRANAEAVVVVIRVGIRVSRISGIGAVNRADHIRRGGDAHAVIAGWQIGEGVQAAAGGGRAGNQRSVAGEQFDGQAVQRSIASVKRAVGVDIFVNQIANADFVETKVNGHVSAVIGLVALGAAGIRFEERFGVCAKRYHARTHFDAVEITVFVQAAIPVQVRVGRGSLADGAIRVADGLRRPVAIQRRARGKIGSWQDDNVVACRKVVEQVVPIRVSDRFARGDAVRLQNAGCAVAGVQPDGDTRHARFGAIDGAAVIGVVPDAVAEGVVGVQAAIDRAGSDVIISASAGAIAFTVRRASGARRIRAGSVAGCASAGQGSPGQIGGIGDVIAGGDGVHIGRRQNLRLEGEGERGARRQRGAGPRQQRDRRIVEHAACRGDGRAQVG